MCRKKCQKKTNSSLSDVFFEALNAPKLVLRPCLDSLRRSPDRLVGWEGDTPIKYPDQQSRVKTDKCREAANRFTEEEIATHIDIVRRRKQ